MIWNIPIESQYFKFIPRIVTQIILQEVQGCHDVKSISLQFIRIYGIYVLIHLNIVFVQRNVKRAGKSLSIKKLQDITFRGLMKHVYPQNTFSHTYVYGIILQIKSSLIEGTVLCRATIHFIIYTSFSLNTNEQNCPFVKLSMNYQREKEQYQ